MKRTFQIRVATATLFALVLAPASFSNDVKARLAQMNAELSKDNLVGHRALQDYCKSLHPTKATNIDKNIDAMMTVFVFDGQPQSSALKQYEASKEFATLRIAQLKALKDNAATGDKSVTVTCDSLVKPPEK